VTKIKEKYMINMEKKVLSKEEVVEVILLTFSLQCSEVVVAELSKSKE
jgi:hypothetical protein